LKTNESVVFTPSLYGYTLLSASFWSS
jgi:hypothetical protein